MVTGWVVVAGGRLLLPLCWVAGLDPTETFTAYIHAPESGRKRNGCFYPVLKNVC